MEALLGAGMSAMRGGTVVLLAAWIASLFLRRAPAAVRHVVWIAGLGAMVFLATLAAAPVRWPAPVEGLATIALSVDAAPQTSGDSGALQFVSVWAVISALQLLQQVRAHLLVRGMARDGRRLPSVHGVRVIEAPAGVGPMTWGFAKPVVFLPPEAFAWEPGLRDAVLRHELAHCERADCLWLLLSRLATCLFWFQPLTWLAARHIAVECERAADDAVLRGGVNGQNYAEWLVSLARSLRGEPTVALAMGRSTEFEGRLNAVLDETTNRRRIGRATAFALAAGIVALMLPVAAAQKAKPAEKAYKIGEGVSAPAPLKKVEPEYTQEARDAKLMGTVLLSVVIDVDGVAREVKVRRGLGLGLDENAVKAIRQWQFKPGMKDGKPVRVRASIEVNFRLN